nr:MAG TPA: TRAP Tryptophan RNA-binding attenuator protein inhibitory protein [Bacteriophage sp.]DAU14626.1 MAG TPA: TRAP Tryptophan RNA-binding attenuator protein inhibitory protein [Caudoviricetes sp.]
MGNQDKHCYQCKHRHKLYCEKPCNACNGNPMINNG